MTYTPQQLNQLRRMAALTADDQTYTDSILTEMLDTRLGDLNATASDIWDEKVAAVAEVFDFATDGGDYKRSQLIAQYQAEAAKYRSRSGFELDPMGADYVPQF